MSSVRRPQGEMQFLQEKKVEELLSQWQGEDKGTLILLKVCVHGHCIWLVGLGKKGTLATMAEGEVFKAGWLVCTFFYWVGPVNHLWLESLASRPCRSGLLWHFLGSSWIGVDKMARVLFLRFQIHSYVQTQMCLLTWLKWNCISLRPIQIWVSRDGQKGTTMIGKDEEYWGFSCRLEKLSVNLK